MDIAIIYIELFRSGLGMSINPLQIKIERNLLSLLKQVSFSPNRLYTQIYLINPLTYSLIGSSNTPVSSNISTPSVESIPQGPTNPFIASEYLTA